MPDINKIKLNDITYNIAPPPPSTDSVGSVSVPVYIENGELKEACSYLSATEEYTGVWNVVLGKNAKVDGYGSVAIGENAEALQDGIAIGRNAHAVGHGSIQIGAGANTDSETVTIKNLPAFDFSKAIPCAIAPVNVARKIPASSFKQAYDPDINRVPFTATINRALGTDAYFPFIQCICSNEGTSWTIGVYGLDKSLRAVYTDGSTYHQVTLATAK